MQWCAWPPLFRPHHGFVWSSGGCSKVHWTSVDLGFGALNALQVLQMLSSSDDDAAADGPLSNTDGAAPLGVSVHGGGSGVGFGASRRPLFESANEERLAHEVAMASQLLGGNQAMDRSYHASSGPLGLSATGARQGGAYSSGTSPGGAASLQDPPPHGSFEGGRESWASGSGVEVTSSSASREGSTSSSRASAMDKDVESGVLRTAKQHSAPDAGHGHPDEDHSWLSASMPSPAANNRQPSGSQARQQSAKPGRRSQMRVRAALGQSGLLFVLLFLFCFSIFFLDALVQGLMLSNAGFPWAASQVNLDGGRVVADRRSLTGMDVHLAQQAASTKPHKAPDPFDLR